MLTPVICAWLRNDLRVHDSAVLQQAAEASRARGLPVLPVYCLDPRHFRRTRHGTLKTGPVRARFLLQSILDLKRRLRSLSSDLLVRVGRPEESLPPLLPEGSLLLTQEEVTSEELGVDRRLRDRLQKEGVAWKYCWGSTLFHREDLPFKRDLSDMPDVYTRFKNEAEPELACKANEVPPTWDDKPKLETNLKVRPCMPEPKAGSLPLPERLGEELAFEPAWADLPYAEPQDEPAAHEGGVMDFEGGETAGLRRLRYYVEEARLAATYVETRNGLLGADYSTKFAPWLSLGCVSPRRVWELIREHEKRFAATRSTYWLHFALTARDFFRFFSLKHGTAIFRPGGPLRRFDKWKGGDREFSLWAEGRTGYPFVDANMRELKATGFMSNRGRQNVASFLVLDLSVDWRRGADWFESELIDYDVAANWANWVFAAGLTGGRINRFNVVRQSKMYDAEGDYIRHWVEELRSVPAEFVYEPWLMSEEQQRGFGAEAYPPPCLPPDSFTAGGGGNPGPRGPADRRQGAPKPWRQGARQQQQPERPASPPRTEASKPRRWLRGSAS